MFRRRRRAADEPRAEQAAGPAPTEPADDSGADAAPPSTLRPDRHDGPWDREEVGADAAEGRLDLGAMLLPGIDGMQLRLDVDEQAGRIVAVNATIGESTLQVQPFAAPRTTGIWEEVRADIAASVAAQGGATREHTGAFGIELLAELPVRLPDGTPAVQAARFVGVDGPRWFLRGVFTGPAYADPEAAAELERMLRGIVVVRGSAPMARGELLELRLPADAQSLPDGAVDEPIGEAGDVPPGADPEERPPLEPFRRGPEITEIR
jgi:hypothetical protein